MINLVMLLQRQEVMTATRLARELGVTPRTIARDIVELADAGIGVEPVRGRTGGYRLSHDVRIRLGNLDREEVEALFLSGVPEAVSGLGLSRASAAARLKLGAALAPALRGAPSRVGDRFHLDAPAWFREVETPPALTEVARAVWHDHPITVEYQAGTRLGAETPPVRTRTLQPYGLVLKAGVWYLIARHHDRFLAFRLDRMVRLRIEDDTFDRSREFDLVATWRDLSDRFGSSMLVQRITIRLTEEGVKGLKGAISPHAWSMVRDELPPHGSAMVDLPVENLDVAVAEMFRLGAEVEILAPDSARMRMARQVARLADMYLR
ncbi:putative DNA-binding transcriptional regulator YafY [Stackebrandtia endophytica]|uniref:Putative DNA-binding transcriptional regulator YafY n=1 Tax=Stackebrandtia endophytica TaxID=1496996 RepID=A0A543ATS6_9ACTN|nr:putative DNA-binding transcriptional regulator YafY [Stackebrandtia endophytica]